MDSFLRKKQKTPKRDYSPIGCSHNQRFFDGVVNRSTRRKPPTLEMYCKCSSRTSKTGSRPRDAEVRGERNQHCATRTVGHRQHSPVVSCDYLLTLGVVCCTWVSASVCLLSHISPMKRLFVLKTLSRTRCTMFICISSIFQLIRITYTVLDTG